MLRISFFLLCTFLTVAISFGQTDQELDQDPEKRKAALEEQKNRPSVIDITDNIFMLQGMGGNILVQDGIDGVLIVDTQFEKTAKSVAAVIKQKTGDSANFVINTHMHGDHTGGNKSFKRKGATILAHKNVRDKLIAKMLSEKTNTKKEKLQREIAKLEGQGATEKAARAREEISSKSNRASTNTNIDQETLPAIAFEQSLLFHYNNEDIMLTHLPNAHTNGDIVIHFQKNNVLHTGDAFLNGRYPYIDIDNGGSYHGYLRGLQTIEKMVNDNTKIIPGHGNEGNKYDVTTSITMLEKLYERVKFHYLNNKTEQEIIAMRDFTKSYDDKGFGEGFITTERILQTLYKEVDKNEGDYKRNQEMKQREYEKMKKKTGGK